MTHLTQPEPNESDSIKSILAEKGYEKCPECGRELDIGDLAWNEASTSEGTPMSMVVCQCQACNSNIFIIHSWTSSIDTVDELWDVLDSDLKEKQ